MDMELYMVTGAESRFVPTVLRTLGVFKAV